jgi:hypothetical protein
VRWSGQISEIRNQRSGCRKTEQLFVAGLAVEILRCGVAATRDDKARGWLALEHCRETKKSQNPRLKTWGAAPRKTPRKSALATRARVSGSRSLKTED